MCTNGDHQKWTLFILKWLNIRADRKKERDFHCKEHPIMCCQCTSWAQGAFCFGVLFSSCVMSHQQSYNQEHWWRPYQHTIRKI